MAGMDSDGHPVQITILTSDLAGNSLGATVRLAHYLAPEFSVEIVGPAPPAGINEMYRREFAFRTVDLGRHYRFPDFFPAVRRLSDAVGGRIVLVVKALAPALPAALRAKSRRGVPVAVYLDEWDAATAAAWSPFQRLRAVFRDARHPCDDAWSPHWERAMKRADLVLGTTDFLVKRFGAVRHDLGTDTDFFRPPAPEVRARLRGQLGLENERVVVFGGVARPHKGVDVLAQAAADAGWQLLVVGPENAYVGDLRAQKGFGKHVHCTGAVPFRQMPGWLGTADALAVPLGDGLLAQSQMPCKIFEAMAMGIPVVASRVSDVPRVLGDAGWLTAPGNAAEIAAALREIASAPAAAAGRAAAARLRAVELFDARLCAGRLRDLLRPLLAVSPS